MNIYKRYFLIDLVNLEVGSKVFISGVILKIEKYDNFFNLYSKN